MLQVEQINTSEMMRILQAAKTQPSDSRSSASFEEVRKTAIENLDDTNTKEWFQNRLHENLGAIHFDHSVVNGAVDITEEGLEMMRTDSAYCEQIMALLRHEFSLNYSPRHVSIHVNVGSTLDEYRVDTWTAQDEAEFNLISANSFYKRIGRTAAKSLAEFASGLFGQFRQQLQAAHDEMERHAETTGNALRARRVASRYEANAEAYSNLGSFAMRAYEG